MDYFLLIIFALSPSLIWLFYFLREDVHPESNRMVLKIFFYGMIIALPTVFLELGFSEEIKKLPIPEILIFFLSTFIGVAFIEEFFKYLVVREKVLSDPEFDEPLDIVLYMIISALGFATVENLLLLFSQPHSLIEAFFISSYRFVGAILLHALASGLFGYFIALSFFEPRKKIKFFIVGLFLAFLLHGFYNSFIFLLDPNLRVYFPILQYFPLVVIMNLEKIILLFSSIILISLALILYLAFQKLKRIASICKIR